jgi:hypothetical protein
MIKEIPKSDVVVRPFKVYKEWTLTHESVGIYPLFAKSGSLGNYELESDEKTYGIPKIPLYSSIKAQFYNNSATASILTEVGRRKSYASTDERIIEDEIAILAIPQIKYGEGIKIGSVTLVDGSITYTDDGYSNLIDSGSNIKGNIFYDRGLIVLAKDIVSGSTLSNFDLKFRSTKTIYENEIFLSVLENEFNVSTNPTAINWNSDRTYGEIKPEFLQYDVSASVDPNGSYLAPYITTIGLYDDNLNMVAVAKLPQPIKSLPDYPINFIVRFDT